MMPDAAPPSERALRRAPERREAALLLGTVLLLYIPGGYLQLTNLRWGLLVTQLCFVATPVFLAIRVFYLDGRAILRLRRPLAAHLCGAVLGTAGMKFNAWQNLLVSAHVVVALNDAGLRSRVTPVIGMDYSF